MTNIPEVDDVINKLEDALSSYEKTVSVASIEGLDIATKEINYQWTYVQSVFFTSTIITTVGKSYKIPYFEVFQVMFPQRNRNFITLCTKKIG